MLVDMEIEIVHELGVKVLDQEESMVKASELYGELDSLVALALCADKYHWTAPRMVHSTEVSIQGGRHPLVELVVPSFIQNDCDIEGGAGSQASESGSMINLDSQPSIPNMLIVTGPNHSGKSIYLKQVALIVYLAHTGSFVPADSATIGLTDRILTRISTRESISRNESAFSIDLRQVAFAMNFATRRSLILIDEFGKGTYANNGAGLLAALIDHFRSLGDERPKVLLATHFHEVFQDDLVEEGNDMLFTHMDVHLSPDAEDLNDQVTYLFRLVLGRSTSSFGTRCAALNGVDNAVIERAESISRLLAEGEDLKAACAKLSTDEEKKLEVAETTARRFLELEIPQTAGRGGSTEGGGEGHDTNSTDILKKVMLIS